MAYTGPVVNPPATGDSPILQYGYVPSLAMGIVGVLEWFIVDLPHGWYFFKKRGTRSVHGLFHMACQEEILGFGARLYMHTHEYSGVGFLIAISLIQIGAILTTAPLYKSVQRGIKHTSVPDGVLLSPMRPRSIVALFTTLDAVFVSMQIAGQFFVAAAQAAQFTNASPTFSLSTSHRIFLGGNLLQAQSMIAFIILQVVILRRSDRNLANADAQVPRLKPLWIQILVSCGLIIVRLLFRIAQGIQGLYGFAATNEVLFAVFDFLPLLAIVALWGARPLWKFIFPLGQRPVETAQASDVGPANAPPLAINATPRSSEAEIAVEDKASH